MAEQEKGSSVIMMEKDSSNVTGKPYRPNDILENTTSDIHQKKSKARAPILPSVNDLKADIEEQQDALKEPARLEDTEEHISGECKSESIALANLEVRPSMKGVEPVPSSKAKPLPDLDVVGKEVPKDHEDRDSITDEIADLNPNASRAKHEWDKPLGTSVKSLDSDTYCQNKDTKELESVRSSRGKNTKELKSVRSNRGKDTKEIPVHRSKDTRKLELVPIHRTKDNKDLESVSIRRNNDNKELESVPIHRNKDTKDVELESVPSSRSGHSKDSDNEYINSRLDICVEDELKYENIGKNNNENTDTPSSSNKKTISWNDNDYLSMVRINTTDSKSENVLKWTASVGPCRSGVARGMPSGITICLPKKSLRSSSVNVQSSSPKLSGINITIPKNSGSSPGVRSSSNFPKDKGDAIHIDDDKVTK